MSILRRHQATFLLPDGEDGEACSQALVEEFQLTAGPQTRRRVTWYETFDWRLHRAGLRLFVEHESGGGLSLCQVDGQQLFHGENSAPLGFAVDLPDGPLREILAPVIEMRRLLPFSDLDLQSQEYRFLDGEAKTVARLYCEQGAVKSADSSAAQPLSSTIEVRSVLGYDRAWKRLIEHFEERLELQRLGEDEFERVALALGRSPGDYSSKVKVELDSEAPMVDSTRCIHLSLLAAIKRNQEGTRRDLDSEFLHDFRVAVRRTRSALSQIKGVFPDAAVAYFKKEFGWLGRITGPTRDLDVYLLKLDDYRDSLPPEIHQDLDPLGRLLLKEQRREQRKLARTLGTQRYRQLLIDWQRFLEEGVVPEEGKAETTSEDEEQTPAAQQPTRNIAAARVWKVYRRVIRRGMAIEEATPAASVHEVRIDCKKLRYLMEFFKGLYPPAKITGLIKTLKRLQDNLGDFNDYEVQQESLGGLADRLVEVGEGNAATLLAMGRLQARLAEGQAEERHRFGKVFARFAAEENQQRFRALFKA